MGKEKSSSETARPVRQRSAERVELGDRQRRDSELSVEFLARNRRYWIALLHFTWQILPLCFSSTGAIGLSFGRGRAIVVSNALSNVGLSFGRTSALGLKHTCPIHTNGRSCNSRMHTQGD
ncbi:hypothetical protein U1Q18_028437 [Sarracenia purpurea var. burkii]